MTARAAASRAPSTAAPPPMAHRLLVANLGSTSFKFRLFGMPEERLLARGGAERIGSTTGNWSFSPAGAAPSTGSAAFADHHAAILHFQAVLADAGLLASYRDLAAVGFKPVMARGISGTRHLDGAVLEAMAALNTLFPAHNPPYIAAVRAFNHVAPGVPCIGTFETAFYDHLPPAATRFAIPLDWETRFGLRRTGFHGASHRYVNLRAAQLRRAAGLPTDDLRVISCHLGGSSSVCAARAGRAVDSSWGMTAQSGLPQNNRSGDLDVFAVLHLLKDHGLPLATVEHALASESGLKGMSGLPTGDIRDVQAAAAAGNATAASALDVFILSVRGYIGRMLATLSGADVLVLTAGIAENNPDIRARICSGFGFAGIHLDAAANAAARATEAVLSTPGSPVEIRLIPTDEEIIIARDAWALLHHASP